MDLLVCQTDVADKKGGVICLPFCLRLISIYSSLVTEQQAKQRLIYIFLSALFAYEPVVNTNVPASQVIVP